MVEFVFDKVLLNIVENGENAGYNIIFFNDLLEGF